MGPEDGAQVRPSELVGQFLVDLGLNQKLSDYGATRETVPAILDAVVRSTGHIWTNPRPVTLEALEDILLKAL
jgi:alcohol dehydrogenase class IV